MIDFKKEGKNKRGQYKKGIECNFFKKKKDKMGCN